eukprot:3731044-Amphidinium_carterae.1
MRINSQNERAHAIVIFLLVFHVACAGKAKVAKVTRAYAEGSGLPLAILFACNARQLSLGL